MKWVDSKTKPSCQQQKSKRKGYKIIRHEFWEDKSLSDFEVRLLGWLNSHSKKFTPSMRTIAKTLCKSITTIGKAIKRLEAVGWLTVIRSKGRESIYKVAKKISTTVSKTDTPTVSKTDTHSTISSSTLKSNNDECRIKNNPPPKPSPKPSPKPKQVIIEGEKLSVGSAGRLLAELYHGNEGYTFKKVNKKYKFLLEKHGPQNAFNALYRYFQRNMGCQTIKWNSRHQRAIFGNMNEIISAYS